MRFTLTLLITGAALSGLTVSNSQAAAPPANSIPVVGLKAHYEDIDTELFCLLSWHHFHGLSQQFHTGPDILNNVVLPGDTTGMLTLVNPWKLTEITQLRAHMNAMDTDSAFVLPFWNGRVVHNTVYGEDGLLSMYGPAEMKADMQEAADSLVSWFADDSTSVWFYYGTDEAPAKQWNRLLSNTTALDNVIPNFFTQDSHYVCRYDIDSTWRWQPTMEEVDRRGVISWMAYHIHEADSTREMSHVLSCMHTITDWAGFNNVNDRKNDCTPPTPADQAAAVRAIFSMEYQGYNPTVPQPPVEENSPSFIALDAYPFRLVGTEYQEDNSYTQNLGDSLDNWMLNHYEECMDSTFITAFDLRNSTPGRDISLFFVPQSFGRAGGAAMWVQGNLNYNSYTYRIPTPQEYRMTCNSALLRGAKAILPYCLTSYAGGPDRNRTDAGLLDENNIPFDAPYEEWVYMDRPTDSLSYISPDLIAPFISGFDPLYSLPARPDTSGEKGLEIYLEWKFAAYARLWNSLERTHGDIARVAPELGLLNWWEDHENEADIDYSGSVPSMFITPQIKVFTDAEEDYCYLYYLNRYCRENDSPFEIKVKTSNFPSGIPFSVYALDHNRRCLVKGNLAGQGTYIFPDTLDAGEGRLLQMLRLRSIEHADIRITDPDLSVILPSENDTLTEYRSASGEIVNIHARFYNMGTDSLDGLIVYLTDDTNHRILDTVRVSFAGLDTVSCRQPDMTEAVFSWTPDNTDTGVHRLRVYTQTIPGEPDPLDNQARLVYVVNPCDYATKVLGDPWDMTEQGSAGPAWHTNDISSLSGWETGSYTDSISGMFEGTVSCTSGLTNMMTLQLNGSTVCGSSYHSISLIGKSEYDCDVYLIWETNTALVDSAKIGNFDSSWKILETFDLGSISTWDGSTITEVSLSFRRSGNSDNPIRLGWVKLTD